MHKDFCSSHQYVATWADGDRCRMCSRQSLAGRRVTVNKMVRDNGFQVSSRSRQLSIGNCLGSVDTTLVSPFH